MLSEDEIEALVGRTKELPAVGGDYLDTDLITCLFVTVIDFQMRTTTVEKALSYFEDNRSTAIRDLGDLEALLNAHKNDQPGNTAVAEFLFNYKLWTRVGLLRALVTWLRTLGIKDLKGLKRWAERSEFARDFQGQIQCRAGDWTYGLGLAVYNSLMMRLGIEAIKPDTRLRRFIEATIMRKVSDDEIVVGLTEVAGRLSIRPREIDSRIWEAMGTTTP
jgi:hypothetical protein